MTAIWIDEKSGARRVAADRKTAEHKFGNGGRVYETSEELAADGTIQTAMLVSIYNEYASDDKVIKKFADRQTAANRTFKAIMINEPVTASADEQGTQEAPNGATAQPVTPSVPATTAAPKKTGKRGAKGQRSKRIFPIDGKDPFKSGASAATWKMIKDQPGKTFAEYVAMGGRANTIAGAIRNQWVRLED